MIPLTRLNGAALLVNSDLIKFVEQAPDTVITLLNGEKILVRESAEEIAARVVQFRQSLALTSFTAKTMLDPAPSSERSVDPEHPEE
jgi:flagellar protein FlbD